MKDQLTLTVDTTNVLILNETAHMLHRIANAQCPAMPMAVPTAPIAVASDVDGTLSATITPTEAFEQALTAVEDGFMDGPEAEGVTTELDVTGMTWDDRIHTATRSKVKDGTWMFKRGLTEDVKNVVLAEYGTQVAPTPPTPPVAPVAPVVPTPPATTVSGGITTFIELMPALRKAGVTQADSLAACEALGLANLIAFNHPANQHLIPELAAILGL